MARANSSFPVPGSPSIITASLDWPSFGINFFIFAISVLFPTTSGRVPLFSLVGLWVKCLQNGTSEFIERSVFTIDPDTCEPTVIDILFQNTIVGQEQNRQTVSDHFQRIDKSNGVIGSAAGRDNQIRIKRRQVVQTNRLFFKDERKISPSQKGGF